MRAYDLRIAALAIRAPVKWIDNLLSQHDVVEIPRARRGVARTISHTALVHLALTRELHVSLGLGVREALQHSQKLLANSKEAGVPTGHLRISVDRETLERTLDTRLREGLESAPSPRRGRPRRRLVPK